MLARSEGRSLLSKTVRHRFLLDKVAVVRGDGQEQVSASGHVLDLRLQLIIDLLDGNVGGGAGLHQQMARDFVLVPGVVRYVRVLDGEIHLFPATLENDAVPVPQPVLEQPTEFDSPVNSPIAA